MALVACGHCIIGVICRVLRLGSCEFSSMEEDDTSCSGVHLSSKVSVHPGVGGGG